MTQRPTTMTTKHEHERRLQTHSRLDDQPSCRSRIWPPSLRRSLLFYFPPSCSPDLDCQDELGCQEGEMREYPMSFKRLRRVVGSEQTLLRTSASKVRRASTVAR